MTALGGAEAAGLQLPTWQVLLPVLIVRSALFATACVPVLVVWRGSRWSLLLTLGFALFMFVGGVYMLQSYWLPVPLRIIHGLELLASSFAYVGALIVLILPWRFDVHKKRQAPVHS